MVLQACIDDSDSDLGERVSLLAGYVLDAIQWAKFSDDWAAALQMHRPIEYFHAVEAQNLGGQFRYWAPEERDRKLVELGKVIRKYEPLSIQCSLERKDFDAILKPVAPYGMSHPYFMNFYGIVILLARHHEQRGVTIPVDFIFDEKGGLGTNALVWYEYVKGLQIPEVKRLFGSTPVFRDDKQFMPLQAADMLAWHMRREAEKREPRECFAAIDLLRADKKHIIVDINKEDLQSLAEAMSGIDGLERFRTKQSWRKIKAELYGRLAAGLHPPLGK